MVNSGDSIDIGITRKRCGGNTSGESLVDGSQAVTRTVLAPFFGVQETVCTEFASLNE